MLIIGNPFRGSKWSLAATFYMTDESPTDKAVDFTESHPWIPEVEVLPPTDEVTIDVLDQLRLRYMTHFCSRHFAQSFPFLG